MNPKIGQLFFTGLQGPSLSDEEKNFLIQSNIGGVVLFERNLESPQQIHSLCREIQSLRDQLPEKAPFFIGIDMEGGRVARLKEPFTQWPPLKKLTPLDSTTVAFRLGQIMGEELAAIGINLNFSPCVDVLSLPENEVIGDRSFGPDPEIVGKLGSALIRGFIKSKVIPCAKHFPGHGNTLADSHEILPVDEVDQKMFAEVMIPPFKKAFRARLDMVMTAHIRYPAIDAEWPATLSEKILKKILRDDIRYRNLVITDDLQMGALSQNFDAQVIPLQALRAGADILLYCHDFKACQEAFETVQRAAANKDLDMLSISKSYDLIMKVKKAKLQDFPEMDFSEAEKVFQREEHKSFAESLMRGEMPSIESGESAGSR